MISLELEFRALVFSVLGRLAHDQLGLAEGGTLSSRDSFSEPFWDPVSTHYWVAVKELTLSYYIGETLSFPIYTHYGDLI